MTPKLPLACVACENLPRSLTCELSRLLGPHIEVRATAPQQHDLVPLATVSSWRGNTDSVAAPVLSGPATRIVVTLAASSASPLVVDVSNPRAQLALLALFAAMYSTRCDYVIAPPVWLQSQIHVQVA